MTDHISARFIHASVNDVQRDIARLSRDADTAAKRTVQQVTAVFKRGAAQRSPVYRGPARNVRVNGELIPLVPGELRKSFRGSRLKRRGDGDYSTVIGPRGAHVHLYAAKIDALTPIVKPAYDEALGRAREIHEREMARAIAKGGK